MRPALLLTMLLAAAPAVAEAPKTLLAVFPHPDDESNVGEVLAKYADAGYRVRLVIATDGKSGTRVTDIPAGERLGSLRKDESRCAARAIGIPEPVFLGIERFDTQIGVGKYLGEHARFLMLLKQQIVEADPDFIITFGPDGDTAHAEHIVTGAAVTALLLREGWVERYPLYYLAWTPEQGKQSDLGHVATRYLNVKVDYSQALEDRALRMMPCYRTQYTAAEIKEDREKKLADKSNATYFRRFVVERGLRDGF